MTAWLTFGARRSRRSPKREVPFRNMAASRRNSCASRRQIAVPGFEAFAIRSISLSSTVLPNTAQPGEQRTLLRAAGFDPAKQHTGLFENRIATDKFRGAASRLRAKKDF